MVLKDVPWKEIKGVSTFCLKCGGSGWLNKISKFTGKRKRCPRCKGTGVIKNERD